MIQSIINTLYRHPKGKLKEIKHLGGLFSFLRMNHGMKRMRETSKQLIVEMPETFHDKSPSVSFLTGQRFWFQTIFCIYSLQKVSPVAIRFVIYDDGSIDDNLESEIKRQVPGIIVHRKAEIDNRLEKLFPPTKYPYLNHKRSVYPHIKKLIDIHVGNSGWNLVADSDMLFFRKPDVVLNWLESPDKPFHILDKFNAYGFSEEKILSVLKTKIPDRVNVGLVGLNSEQIDWDMMEKWAKELEDGQFSSYFLEQTLTAMHLAGKECVIGDDSEYIVLPSNEQIQNQTGILHHYVDTSKPGYFTVAWKFIFH